MTTYSFTFARGGSKGLPNKNLLPFDGVPLIGRAIQQSKSVDLIDKSFVSTDSRQIADVALSFGAEVIYRPSELASDTSPEWLSWQHAVSHVHNKYGPFDRFVSIPTTSPLRIPDDIISCLKQDISNGQVVITYTDSHRNPWFNLLTPCVNNPQILTPACTTPGVAYSRRQDAPQCYDMATVAYVALPQNILDYESLFSLDFVGVFIPLERSIDIDTELDYKFAEYLLTSKNV